MVVVKYEVTFYISLDGGGPVGNLEFPLTYDEMTKGSEEKVE